MTPEFRLGMWVSYGFWMFHIPIYSIGQSVSPVSKGKICGMKFKALSCSSRREEELKVEFTLLALWDPFVQMPGPILNRT